MLKKILTKVKQLLRHIFLLIAILMTTTPAWAAATCHTSSSTLSFTTDASYETGDKWYNKKTYYYYSTPKQTFVTITDNSYNTFSNISCKVTGDTEDGEQKFKIIYKTSSSGSWNETNTEYILNRNWVSTSIISGHYEAGYTDINLSLPNNTTEIGIYFTNYNANGSGDTKHRTITISNVSVSFSPYFQSEANNTTLEAFPSTKKGTTCSTTRSFTYKYNNTVTSVNWESSNPMFTVSSTHTDDCSGEKVVTITFKPTEIRSEITGTITGTDNNGNKIIVYVKGSSWGKEEPTYTWKPEIWNGTSQARTIYVGETINNLLTYTSSQADCTYSIEKLEEIGSNNGDATTTFTNNTLVAERAGKYRLTVSQPEYLVDGSGYNAGSSSIILTVSKHEISASISPTSALWNETLSNPFSLTDGLTKFNVESLTPRIAKYNATTKTIQTYYTSGDAQFQITRPEDYKYMALNSTLTLTVNQSENSCYALQNAATSNDITNNENATSETFALNGSGETLTFTYKLNSSIGSASNDHYITPQYSTNGKDFYAIPKDGGGNYVETTTSMSDRNSQSIPVPIEATHIRFLRTTENGRGNRTIRITQINITRKKHLTPSVTSLSLDPTISNKNSEKTFTLDWSTCEDEIKVISTNQYLKVSIDHIDASAGGGTASITVSCETNVLGNHEGKIAIYDHTQMIEIPVSCLVKEVTIPEFKGDDTHEMKVGDIWNANFEFIRTQGNIPTFSETAENTGFYYYIEHNVTTDNITGSEHPDKVIQYTPTYNDGVVINTITALNKGTAILHIIQAANAEYQQREFICTITVDKTTPTFVWKDPVYFNQTIIDYFSTNNTDTEISITQSSTDEDVAILYFNPNNESDKHTLDLTSFYKETTPTSSTQVTVSQAENWYWNAHTESHTIIPKNLDNHVPFTMNTKELRVALYEDHEKTNGNNSCDDNGEISLNQNGGLELWTANPLYYTIEFSGIPDKLSFNYRMTATATAIGNTGKAFIVYESNNGQDWAEVWSSNGMPNNTNDNLVSDIPLKYTTRYLKFFYDGTYTGYYSNITVTELNQFEFTHNTLDFGTVHITDNTTKTLTTNFQYANAGHKINIDLNRTGAWDDNEAYELAKKYIAINPASITDIGGEKVGEKEIQITLHSDDKTPYTIPEGAKIKIWDEAGRCDYLTISGLIKPSKQEIVWIPYFQLEEPIAIPLETGDVKNAAQATSNLPITYETDQPTVIRISADQSYFTPIAVGNATITAIQEGDQKYSRVTSSKKITITHKMVQIISWPVDLTDLILVDNPAPITLDAKVYLLDLVNNRPVFSQEQTNKIIYSVENEEVVKIVDGQLVIVGLGSTTITAAITEKEDSHYESTSLTLPVIVRKPALGCEDILLLDQSTEVEFFTDGINTNEIIKDAMAIDCTLGIPGRVEFQHKGEAWKLFGNVSFYEGSINVQQSTDGGNTWSDVQNSTPTLSVYKPTIAALDRNATHIRFVRPSGGQGYHYYKDVKVYPAQYIESEVSNIDFEDINIGGTYTKKINISYSNIKSPIRYESSSSDITVSPSNFGECGKFGTKELTITWKPTTKVGQQTITFIDDLSEIPDLTINLTANIFGRLQEIIWEDSPGAILNHTDIDNRPTYTIDANSKESTSLKIQYEVIEGTENAYFIDDMFFLLNEGNITIKAYHPGNEEYAAVEEIYKFPIQTVPPTFIGTEDQLWNNENNWKNKIMPSEEYSIANIAAPVKIDNLHVDINNVRISDKGSVHITSTGGLDVGKGGIQSSKDDGSAIIIDNFHSGAGFLRIDPAYTGTMPRITMRYQTKSTLDNGANKDATWQYIGAPGLNSTIYVDYNTWLYKLDEPEKDWVLQEQTANVELKPFEGYAITQYGTPTYEWTADFTNQNCTIPLTYSKNGRGGRHIIANSYTAPINVSAFTGDEFEYLDGMDSKYRIEKTLYIYNSGSWNNWNNNNGSKPETSGNEAGQYYAIPVLAAQYLAEDDHEQTTIAPMQGIYLRVRSRKALPELPENGEQVGNLYLNYNSLVMDTNHEMHHPMRAPQKNIADAMHSENFRRVRIVATSENSGADRLYIIQDDINTRKYNNGYDAPNQETKGLVSIYTNESGGKMEVSCSNNIDSMYIGFMAGEDQTYTLHFSALIGDVLYLQDLMNGQEVRIVENGSYTFEADPQSTNDKRFLLLTSSKLATNIDDTHAANIWYSNSTNTLYITNALDNSTLVLYDASGHQVLSTTVSHTPYTLNLSYLTKGMYMARINNHVYKFVCK